MKKTEVPHRPVTKETAQMAIELAQETIQWRLEEIKRLEQTILEKRQQIVDVEIKIARWLVEKDEL